MPINNGRRKEKGYYLCKISNNQHTRNMKKLLFLLFLLIVTSVGIAQSQQHLSFKGVPIDGTLKEYTNAMIKAGFHFEGTEDGISILSGDFAGFKDCIIGVSTLKNCNVVSHIAVLFPEKETWSSLLDDYEQLKTMLTKKYGKPERKREKFTGYVGDFDNGLVMYALRDGEYEWYTVFSTELGNIELSIVEGTRYLTGMVRLSYFDKVNSEKVLNSAMDDL